MRDQTLVFWSWLNCTSFRRASKRLPWIRRRFDLWKTTALRSIVDQTIADWHYVLLCDPKTMHLTEGLREEIDDPRVQLVHLGPEDLEWRRSLPESRKYVVARLDSDDRYHPGAGRALLRRSSRTSRARPYLQFGRGFAHVLRTGELFDWHQRSSPFNARVFGPEYRELESIRVVSHNKVAPRALAMAGGYFVVTIHGANTSTTLRCRCVKGPVGGARARRVARQFGLGKVVTNPAKKVRKPWAHLRARDLPKERGRVVYPSPRRK